MLQHDRGKVATQLPFLTDTGHTTCLAVGCMMKVEVYLLEAPQASEHALLCVCGGSRSIHRCPLQAQQLSEKWENWAASPLLLSSHLFNRAGSASSHIRKFNSRLHTADLRGSHSCHIHVSVSCYVTESHQGHVGNAPALRFHVPLPGQNERAPSREYSRHGGVTLPRTQ